MKKYFRYVDRRVAVVLIVLFLVLLVLNRTWVRSVGGGLDEARNDLKVAQQDLSELRTRLAEARTQGITGVEALRSRVERLEAIVPFGLDDITFTQAFVDVAESSGVQLEAFQLAPVETPKSDKENSSATNAVSASGLRIEGMRPFAYRFKVTGPYPALNSFLINILASESFTISIDGFTIYSVSEAENPSIFDDIGTLEGTLTVWTMLERPLGSSADESADEAGGEGDANDSGEPTAGTDAPGDQTPATDAPTTDAPTTDAPTTDAPADQPPVTETPAGG